MNFEFLKEMFRRLAEMKQFKSQATSEAEKHAWDSACCAIAVSIKDYLRLHTEPKP